MIKEAEASNESSGVGVKLLVLHKICLPIACL